MVSISGSGQPRGTQSSAKNLSCLAYLLRALSFLLKSSMVFSFLSMFYPMSCSFSVYDLINSSFACHVRAAQSGLFSFMYLVSLFLKALLISSNCNCTLFLSLLSSMLDSSNNLTSSVSSSIFLFISLIFLSKSVFSPSHISLSKFSLLLASKSSTLSLSPSVCLFLVNSRNSLSNSIFLLSKSKLFYWPCKSQRINSVLSLSISPLAKIRASLVS